MEVEVSGSTVPGFATFLPCSVPRGLVLAGAIAPLVAIALYAAELILIPAEAYPDTVAAWLALFAENPLRGLWVLNSLDIISIGVLGITALALDRVLRERAQAAMTIATPFAFVGVAVFIVPRTELFALVDLGRQYARSGDATERAQLEAAGRALAALGVPTIQTFGFLVLSFAFAIVSAVLLVRTRMRLTGAVGIVAFLLTAADAASALLWPHVATALLVVAGLAWIAWWALVSTLLFRGFARGRARRE